MPKVAPAVASASVAGANWRPVSRCSLCEAASRKDFSPRLSACLMRPLRKARLHACTLCGGRAAGAEQADEAERAELFHGWPDPDAEPVCGCGHEKDWHTFGGECICSVAGVRCQCLLFIQPAA